MDINLSMNTRYPNSFDNNICFVGLSFISHGDDECMAMSEGQQLLQQIERLTSALYEKEREIDELRRKLDERHKYVESLAGKIAEREKNIERLEALNKDWENEWMKRWKQIENARKEERNVRQIWL